ncbi:alpha/beta hydrolase [Glycomyces endophyticus]|uniref:Alpha/beta hydrolase n=1 Tax=Glycomyces endophyticus TaxID=480996 RepID=A0ABN2H0Q1_9ACTN
MRDWNLRRLRERYKLATAAPRPDGVFESRWTTVDGVRLHCRATREDPAGRTPVLLVHGLTVSHRYLMPLAARLAERHPVRALDMPGFGLSGDPAATPDVAALAGWIASWIKAVDEGPVAVLGNSFGAQVATALAAGHPDLVRCLILVGPTMDPSAPTKLRQTWRWVRGLPHEDPGQFPVLLRDLADAGLKRAWRTFGIALDDRIERRLPDVRAPVLIARGAKETVAPQSWVRQLDRVLPRAETAVVPGAPHDANYTSPDELAALVFPFLEAELGE